MADQSDPDFLALRPRQQTRIDRAFDRGLPKLRTSGRKRRKLNARKADRSSADDGAGGFMDDEEGGGFMMDDGDHGGEGGFLAEDTGDEGGFMMDEDVAGGFEPEDTPVSATPAKAGPSRPPQTTPRQAIRTGKIPLSRIPGLLASLNLPADEDVMNVFRASATGWTADDTQNTQNDAEAGRRRSRPTGEAEDEDLGVERKDFRAVCAAIMGDDEGDEGMDADEPDDETAGSVAAGVMESEDDDTDEDAFELHSNSSLSSLSDDSEYGASRKKARTAVADSTGAAGGKKAKATSATPAKSRRKKGAKVVEETGPLRLAGRQREIVRDIWDMLKRTAQSDGSAKPPQNQGGRGKKGENNPHILSREEVKLWARELGEMWTEDEITDMVTLFSTQHEGRGLSFDDLGQIMLRARVV